ncbi:MAG TPA: hypothetical protein VM537_18415, partial [Anaerolineae bacterium]|nr:hypothetical protein [Anaerolineae bacterium]
FTRFAFADPLKDDIRAMGFSERAIQEKPPWMRKLMQAYGAARRAEDINHWAKQLRTELVFEYERSAWGFPAIVIDDMRFPNEVEMLETFAAAHYGVEFRNCLMQRTGEQAENLSHEDDESETALDNLSSWWQVFPVAGGDFFGLDRAACNMARD